MTNIEAGRANRRVITAYFDNQLTAHEAVDSLKREGIPDSEISLVSGKQGISAGGSADDKGFWASLKDMFLPDEDRHAYAEGLRRGGYVLSVKADDAHYEHVLNILDADGSVDIAERETAWRKEGWAGYQSAPQAGIAVSSSPSTPVSPAHGAATQPGPKAATLTAGQDETVPVYEENLSVGKRDVSHGRVRLRSYVVETPVNQQVSLRRENVEVNRRPVDRAVAAGDAVFNERVIEVDERAEEAVVAKEIRVKEEVSLRKTSEDHVQNVSDTVRSTHVEVDDTRQGAAGTARSFVAANDKHLIAEHMDVISSDGKKVGVVDHLEGVDRIKLTRSASKDGQHHFVPLAWVDHIDTHVHLNRAEAAVISGW